MKKVKNQETIYSFILLIYYDKETTKVQHLQPTQYTCNRAESIKQRHIPHDSEHIFS